MHDDVQARLMDAGRRARGETIGISMGQVFVRGRQRAGERGGRVSLAVSIVAACLFAVAVALLVARFGLGA